MIRRTASSFVFLARIELVKALRAVISLLVTILASCSIFIFMYLVLLIDIVLLEVDFDWPVDDHKHVDVQVDDCDGEKLNAAISKVPREHTKQYAENEEEVDDLAGTVGDFAGAWDSFVSQAHAAHGRRNQELHVVKHKQE